MTVGPTWTGWSQGQAGLAQAHMNRMMQPVMASGNANLVQGAFGQTTLQTQPGFPGVPLPMAGGQGIPANTMDTTQNPYLQTPMSPMSAPMQYLLSRMPQTDRDALMTGAQRLGSAGRVIFERTGGMLSHVKDKLNPSTPSTMAPNTPGASSSASPLFSFTATPAQVDALGNATIQPIPEDDPQRPKKL